MTEEEFDEVVEQYTRTIVNKLNRGEITVEHASFLDSKLSEWIVNFYKE